MVAVLNKACTAWQQGEVVHYSHIAGSLISLMAERSLSSRVRYRPGSLGDAVLAAHDQDPESAKSWVRAEPIMARERQGESEGNRSRCPSPPIGGRMPGRSESTFLPNVLPRRR